MSAATLPLLLRRNAETMATRPAMREKEFGVWQTRAWRQYWEEVREFALGLAAHGFTRGDKLSVIGDNRPALYEAQLAAQCLGGVSVPLYQDAIAGELVYVLNHAETAVVVAENQEQVDKILSTRPPGLRLVLYDDPRGMRHYDMPFVKSVAEIRAAGREFGAAHPGFVEGETEKGGADDLAFIAYTSGTTARPKGVMLSYRNLIETAEAIRAAEGFRAGDEWLCYLPMAWIADSLFSLVLHLVIGFTCNCPEGPETLQRDLRELGPTIALAPPRFWENALTGILVRTADATPLKRRLFERFRALAERGEELGAAGRPVGLATRLGRLLGDVLVYGPVRDQLGLRRARIAYTGGAPLGPDTYRFFRAFGVNLKQVYGSTELSGLASVQPDAEANPDTVGRLCRDGEVRIAADGEVEIRSPGVFQGYYKQPEATSAALTRDGWFRTGDAGFIDERGHLVIVDRAKDVGRLADGTSFAPQFIENKLKFSPFIGEAIAFGDGKPFVAAIVAIDLATVGSWAERRNLAYTSFQDLAAKPEVRALVGDEIRKCNATLPASLRVRRFLVLNKEFDADDDEITRTRKIRRRFVAEKYAGVVAGFYAGDDEVEVASEITYEDGRKGVLRSRLAVEAVEPAEEAGAQREPAHV